VLRSQRQAAEGLDDHQNGEDRWLLDAFGPADGQPAGESSVTVGVDRRQIQRGHLRRHLLQDVSDPLGGCPSVHDSLIRQRIVLVVVLVLAMGDQLFLPRRTITSTSTALLRGLSTSTKT